MSSEFDSEFNEQFNADGERKMTAQGNSMMAEQDPSKLIDLDLVNLLKFCDELRKNHKNEDNDDYQEELLNKALELGKKTKEKTVILDMDETMIAAKFEGK